MPKYFEKRAYTRQEIAEILRIDPKDKNFARKVRTKLENLGFHEDEGHYIYTRKEVTILWIPQTREERIQYLVALLGIDKQVDAHAFAIFTYRMLWDEDYQRMPWQARTELLREQDDLEYDEKTYRRWTNKLLALDILRKDSTNSSIWGTVNINGEKVQFEVAPDDEGYIKYKTRRTELFNKYAELPPKERWSKTFGDLWNEFHCVYYKCGSFDGKAWADNDIIQELLETVSGYYES